VGYPILCHAARECQCLRYLSLVIPSPIQGDAVTYTITQAATSRNNFRINGVLDNQVADTNFRPIQNNFPIFAISRDLGSIRATQAPVVWAVGYTIDPAISYSDLSGAPPKQRRAYYKTKYADDGSLVSSSTSIRASLLKIFRLDHRFSERLYQCLFKGPETRSEHSPGRCFSLVWRLGFYLDRTSIRQHPAYNRD
jgi:Domain of unknown function (DUF5127)